MTKSTIFSLVSFVFSLTNMVNETRAARIEEPLVAAQKAIRFGHRSKLERLMAAPTWKDSGALLNYVAGQGNLNIVKMLLVRDDADVNEVVDGETALLRVLASKARLQIVEAIVVLLLNAGTHIDSQSAIGDTALHRALRLNKRKIANILIRAGASLSIKNKGGETPFHFMLTRYSVRTIRHLMECVGIRFAIFGDEDDRRVYHALNSGYYRMADGESKRELSSLLAHVTLCSLVQSRRLEEVAALLSFLSVPHSDSESSENPQEVIMGYLGADIPKDERYERMAKSSMALLMVQRFGKDVLVPLVKYCFSLSQRNRCILEQLQIIV